MYDFKYIRVKRLSYIHKLENNNGLIILTLYIKDFTFKAFV